MKNKDNRFMTNSRKKTIDEYLVGEPHLLRIHRLLFLLDRFDLANWEEMDRQWNWHSYTKRVMGKEYFNEQ